MKKLLLLTVCLLTVFQAKAAIAEGDGWSLSDDSVLTVFKDFDDCPWYTYKTQIKSAVFQDGVTSIGASACSYCTKLTSVTISDSVTNIGYCAFHDCDRLTNIVLPTSLRIIDQEAFYGCSKLTSVTIPDSVTIIGKGAFENCSKLTSVTFSDSVTIIRDYAFGRCSSLTSVTLPVGLKQLGWYAFSRCSSLTSVTIPRSLTTILGNAFTDCSGLTSITVEDGHVCYDSRNDCNAIIETWSNTLITGCRNTTIPSSVTCIGDYAFSGQSELTSLVIPSSVTSIGNCAFGSCESLTSVTIPSSVTSIGSSVFANCNALTSVTSHVAPEYLNNNYLGVSGITVYVPYGTTEAYKAAWGADNTYVELPAETGLSLPKVSDGETKIECIYDLSGKPLDRNAENLRKGVYILLNSDGKTKKTVVK